MTLLTIYFAINLFIGGMVFSELSEDAYTWKDWVTTLLVTVLFTLFGILFYSWEGLLWCWTKLNEIFAIKFWWNFWLTKKYYNLTKDQLFRFNMRKHVLEKNKPKEKFTLEDKIFLVGVDKVNKRNNNYVFDPNL